MPGMTSGPETEVNSMVEYTMVVSQLEPDDGGRYLVEVNDLQG